MYTQVDFGHLLLCTILWRYVECDTKLAENENVAVFRSLDWFLKYSVSNRRWDFRVSFLYTAFLTPSSGH